MVRIVLLVLALTIVGASPEPEVHSVTPSRQLLAGNDIRVVSVACAALPKVFNLSCASSAMEHFGIVLAKEDDRYHVLFIRTDVLGGGIAILVSERTYTVVGHHLLQ